MSEDEEVEQPYADETVTKPEADRSVILEVLQDQRKDAKKDMLEALILNGANELCVSYFKRRLNTHLNNFTYMRNYYLNFAPRDISMASLRFGENLAKDLYANYPVFDLRASDLPTLVMDITRNVNSGYWGSHTQRNISDKQLISETTEYRQYQDQPKKRGIMQQLFG